MLISFVRSRCYTPVISTINSWATPIAMTTVLIWKSYSANIATILIIIGKSKKLKEKYETAKQEFEEKSKFKEQKQKVELKENIDGRKLS